MFGDGWFFTKDIESQFQSVIEILIESFIRIGWKLHNHERVCAVYIDG